jgi:hypothetical protein
LHAAWLVRYFADMKNIVVAVLTLFVGSAFFAQKSPAQKQQQQQWREFVYPQDGFAITLPYAPKPYYDQGDRHINVYSVQLGKTVVTLRAISRLMDCETALADQWEEADKKNAKEPLVKGSLKQISPSGMKGLEYETDLGSGERSLHRFQCADEHRFYIFRAGYTGKQRPSDVDRIIKSFHLVSPVHEH